MTERVKSAEQLVRQLTAEELNHFTAWFAEFQDGLWEKQLLGDANAGRLDALAQKADLEIDKGNFRQI